MTRMIVLIFFVRFLMCGWLCCFNLCLFCHTGLKGAHFVGFEVFSWCLYWWVTVLWLWMFVVSSPVVLSHSCHILYLCSLIELLVYFGIGVLWNYMFMMVVLGWFLCVVIWLIVAWTISTLLWFDHHYVLILFLWLFYMWLSFVFMSCSLYVWI
jgi:hypothetical protein